jgi:hypothetical protein
MDFGMFVPWALATKSVVGRVQQAVPAVSDGFFSDSPNRILLLCF